MRTSQEHQASCSFYVPIGSRSTPVPGGTSPIIRRGYWNFQRPQDVLRGIDKPVLENKVGRNIFYIIGVIVVVIAVLSLVGLA